MIARIHFLVLGCALVDLGLAFKDVQAQASIQAFTSRPFVTGVTPVVGPGGGIGGVSIDTDGVLDRADTEKTDRLRTVWDEAKDRLDQEITVQVPRRFVSLNRLDKQLQERLAAKKSPTEEMMVLAGLWRVDYVLAVPELGDVIIAGPAGGWRTNALGEAVNTENGSPVIRLDDLAFALRNAIVNRQAGMSCSIEPTQQGMARFAKLKSKRPTFNHHVVKQMEQALGQQQILLSGVDAQSHFAHVLVVSDFMMKRLAMGLELSPVDGMPSYMDLLKTQRSGKQITSPRWWMACDHQPLLKSADGLVFQIRGGVKTLTEDSLLDSDGKRRDLAEPNLLAERWADQMTENFDALAKSILIFGELRNCMDLAVASSVIAHHGLLTQVDCQLNVLLKSDVLASLRYPVPKSVASKASLVKSGRNWLVSISGGVEIDASSLLRSIQTDSKLADLPTQVTRAKSDRWWW